MLGVWHVLTDQDGATCPFRPSCSGYMITAIRKHGVIVGWMMGMDRYLRDHKWANEDDYPVIEDYLYDPVE
ncbi:MAG: membrane protein insertion efficiency factor YidD [Armatimonadota bacterium]|nr:membrane protein insertion efficiency factor YidD [Armatimonadota bacterium]